MNRRAEADPLVIPCPFCRATAGRPCRDGSEQVMRGSHIQRHLAADRVAPPASKDADDASVVNKDEPRPNLGQAMADAYQEQREARREVQRLTRMYEGAQFVPPEVYAAAVLRQSAAFERLEALVHANAAHQLQWAHLTDECPICTGAVNKD